MARGCSGCALIVVALGPWHRRALREGGALPVLCGGDIKMTLKLECTLFSEVNRSRRAQLGSVMLGHISPQSRIRLREVSIAFGPCSVLLCCLALAPIRISRYNVLSHTAQGIAEISFERLERAGNRG